ncbi:MAG: helix-turn-helix transcriptional regulator [Bacteroidetes bacterium]|nr:helix-turn-helix transcriptional regulator [Bacteroidota bacterium]
MENDVESIGQRIREIRLSRNYSQQYLAQKIGVTQKAYSKIESEETKLGVDTLKKIASILDVPIESFFDSKNKPVINDFSSRAGGDNVLYKTTLDKSLEKMIFELIKSKDQIILSKDEMIEKLKKDIVELNSIISILKNVNS